MTGFYIAGESAWPNRFSQFGQFCPGQEGWPRHRENAAKHPLKAADGVVDLATADSLDLPLRRSRIKTFARVFPSCAGRTVQLRKTVGPRGFPSLRRRGGCAIKRMAPFLIQRRRGSCFKPPIIKTVRDDKRQLETTTPSAPIKGCFAAFFFRSRPPLLREGGDYPFP